MYKEKPVSTCNDNQGDGALNLVVVFKQENFLMVKLQ